MLRILSPRFVGVAVSASGAAVLSNDVETPGITFFWATDGALKAIELTRDVNDGGDTVNALHVIAITAAKANLYAYIVLC
mmetsp:Transcript_13877/g.18997  ORF Transcript_13877/g.18997 Transcript_13877/m.18997 type:complete len:80 (+) Transcript_13877:1936-2175(+)